MNGRRKVIAVALSAAMLLAAPLSAQAAISGGQAKKVALNHAGLTASQVRFTKVRKEREDGRWVFDVEFRLRSNRRIEYEYEIAYRNGRIIDWDRDYDD